MAGRPLRFYAETGLRLRDALRDLPLTPEESQANAASLAALDPEAPPGESLILLKPLDASGGGVEHEGGALLHQGDAAYRCLAPGSSRTTEF